MEKNSQFDETDHLPAKLITPAANVEGEEDGNNMLSDGDDVIKTLNLEFQGICLI